jgi:excisionase family DNA binding protein
MERQQVNMQEVFTEEEAAKFLRVSVRTLYNWRTRGQIAYVPNGRRVLYMRSDLMAFMERQKVVCHG